MEDRMKILIVEDDETLAEEIARFLVRWGYETVTAEDFGDITGEFAASGAHLILMDINLPRYDGFYWCAQIRRISQVPVIYISSRGDDGDKIMAIAQGGDDYVEKPFRLEILRARIEAILRRTYQYRVSRKVYLSSELSFDESTGELFHGETPVDLTKSERRIVARLVEGRGRTVTREELMMALWSTDEYVSDGTLTTLVSRLRRKIQDICSEDIILTKKGQGYQIL